MNREVVARGGVKKMYQKGERVELTVPIKIGTTELPAGTACTIHTPDEMKPQVTIRVGDRWMAGRIDSGNLRKALTTGQRVTLKEAGTFHDIIMQREERIREGTPGTVYGFFEGGNILVRWDCARRSVLAETAPAKIKEARRER